MSITTHVLDATTGRPAAGLELVLSRREGSGWHELTRRRTDGDGRVDARDEVGLTDTDPDAGPGIYRIVFLTEAYLKAQSPAAETFYPEIVVIFRITDPLAPRHHVPLLLSPYAYSTYRGS